MDKELIKNIQLNNIPTEYRKWQTLQYYRGEVDFLPHLMKEKVCEQLMACDYMLGLQLWLKPVSVIYKRHKLIYVQQIASVYEAIIDSYLSKVIDEMIIVYPVLAETIINKRYTEYRTLSTSLALMDKMGKIDLKWKKYINKIAEVRNYIHLKKEEKEEVTTWLNARSSDDFKENLNRFIIFARLKLR